MDYGLSEEQQKAFDFLVEFFEPNRNRGTGRSYVMAAVIIQTAINNPGMEIRIIDHSDMHLPATARQQCHNRIIGIIHHLLNEELPEDIKKGMAVSVANGTVRYVMREPNTRVSNNKNLLDELTKWPEES